MFWDFLHNGVLNVYKILAISKCLYTLFQVPTKFARARTFIQQNSIFVLTINSEISSLLRSIMDALRSETRKPKNDRKTLMFFFTRVRGHGTCRERAMYIMYLYDVHCTRY